MINILKSIFGKSDELGSGVIQSQRDPVCGMQIKGDAITAEYQGKNYYFCSEHCREQFIAMPNNFVD